MEAYSLRSGTPLSSLKCVQIHQNNNDDEDDDDDDDDDINGEDDEQV